jgi:DNA-binding NarL/FixJ family response regulator
MSAVRVLIVDDDADIRALLRATIAIAGQDLEVVDEAVDGPDGVRKWRDERPDVIVLDQLMPGGTGLETATQILAEDPSQPIVLFTAYLDTDLADAAARLGVRACLQKGEVSRLPGVLLAQDA